MSLPRAYRSTVFLLETAPDPLPSTFAIITAWNPMDRATSESGNQSADEALLRKIKLRGASYFRATGCSPDLSHREPGWAVQIGKEEALEWGRNFSQRAIWWIEADALILVDCADGSEERIDSFSARIHGS